MNLRLNNISFYLVVKPKFLQPYVTVANFTLFNIENEANVGATIVNLVLAHTKQRDYIRMGLSTPGASHFTLYLSS